MQLDALNDLILKEKILSFMSYDVTDFTLRVVYLLDNRVILHVLPGISIDFVYDSLYG